MKKVQKLVLGLLLVLLFAGVQTTNIQAAGTDKASAEKITHDTLYEERCESNAEYWYTFTTVDYTNYYVLSATFDEDDRTTNEIHYTVYDQDNTKMGSLQVSAGRTSTLNLKLDPNEKYTMKLTGGGDVSFKLIPHADVADTKDEAQLIEFNKLYEESIIVSGEDEDWYKFETGKYYQNYEILLNYETWAVSLTLDFEIYDEENNKLYELGWFTTGTKNISIDLSPNKTYYISCFNDEGDYSFKVMPGEYYNGWLNAKDENNVEKSYWYEGGLRQGTYDDPKGVLGDGTVRGREIYDPESDGWYWLDSCYEGAKATSKEVWMPYIYQNEADWAEDEINMNAAASGDMANQVAEAIKNGSGKWVRYDENGKMYKGWYTHTNKNKYYYDPKTGLMAKGNVTIDGKDYYFDPITGILQ